MPELAFATFISMIPLLVIFTDAQRFLMRAQTVGAVGVMVSQRNYPTPEFTPPAVYALKLPRAPLPIEVRCGRNRARRPPARIPEGGFEVIGIYNRTVSRAQTLADEYGIAGVFGSVGGAVAAAPAGVVYDIALMREQYLEKLEQFRDGAVVLIQKPLGNHFDGCRRILRLCHQKKLVAAVNTQLRFSPYVAEARAAIAAGAIGELYDFEVRVEVPRPPARTRIAAEAFGLDRFPTKAFDLSDVDAALD